MKNWMILGCMLMVASSWALGADIYKCAQPDGSVSFSDVPCGDGSSAWGSSKSLESANVLKSVSTPPEDNASDFRETIEGPSHNEQSYSASRRMEIERLARSMKLASGSAASFLRQEIERVREGWLDKLSYEQKSIRENALRFIGARGSRLNTHRARQAEAVSQIEHVYSEVGYDFSSGDESSSVTAENDTATTTGPTHPSFIHDPFTGTTLHCSDGGCIDPGTGTHFNIVPGGVINTKTGGFTPTH